MKFKFHNIFQLIFTLCAGTLLFSCTDDSLSENGSDPNNAEEGESIALTLSLQSLTRAGEPVSECEKYEDYIDPGQIILLFFYADDDDNYDTLIRQYGPSELSMIPIEDAVTGNLHNWYVKLPVFDEEDGFPDVLRNHDFKVAALVNWQNSKIELTDAVIENGEIKTPGSDINRLHHLASDNTYGNPAYSFLMEGTGKMGMTKNWVVNNKSSATDAFDWIKENWYPGYIHIPDQSNPENYYTDLRFVWNFNTAYQKGKNSSYDASDDIEGNHADKWADKNKKDFYEWLTKTNAETSLENLAKTEDSSQFEFVGTEQEGDNAKYARLLTDRDKIGILIPAGGSYNENAFRFNLLTSGSILVDWERPSGSNGKVKIQGRNHYDDNQPSKDYTLDYIDGIPQSYPIDDDGKKTEIKVTGDSEYISIYAEGGDVIIYSIEYVQDLYLYNTDRDGVALSPDNLIAMYGIQQYTKLGNYWKKGMLFNLSDFNNLSLLESQYPDYQKISLIRSVAKIELRLPQSFNAHNVYLRSANRRARFEPMDVSSPTNSMWGKDLNGNDKDPLKFEWDNICNAMINEEIHPFIYKGTDKYQERLGWYYGSWAKYGKIFGVDIPEESEDYHYPKILNPRIERSDFARFIKIGEAEGIYTKYILYVPEKFIDDPNTTGRLGDNNPKVCHIEFRRGKDEDNNGLNEDPAVNLDDNYCYRIYLTQDGFYSNNGANQYPSFKKEVKKVDGNGNPIEWGDYITWENHYENNVDILRHHWPIIRNHIYSFTVEDTNQKVLVLKLEVLPWKEVKENTYIW